MNNEFQIKFLDNFNANDFNLKFTAVFCIYYSTKM